MAFFIFTTSKNMAPSKMRRQATFAQALLRLAQRFILVTLLVILAGPLNAAPVRSYTTDLASQAPNAPVLVQPADNAGGISTSPILQVTASDPDASDTLNVQFYGRQAGAAGEDFTLVVIPDMQNESQEMLDSQMNWIVDQKTASNIVFVTSVGDLVNLPSWSWLYDVADAGFDILDAGGVPYSVSPGNHDMMEDSLFNEPQYFGVARFIGKPWYGGYFGDNNYNNYSLFSASGNDFIIINLEYDPAAPQLDWADALLKAYPNRRGILVQHYILDVDDSWINLDTYIALKDNPNLFLMLCGHMHQTYDGAAYRAEPGDDGHTIHVVHADYQDFNDGDGWLRLLRFSPANDMIYMTTYSPYTGEYLTTDPDQKDLAYNLAAVPAFSRIGSVNGVANGANASITWPGLAEGTEYEWYAVVSDGTAATTGSTWSFTTAAAVNVSPVITEPSPVAVTMSEDGAPNAFSLTLHAADGNPADTLTWSIASPASNGTASASGTGASKTIGYAPNDDFAGSDSFVVKVSDGRGGSDTLTVNVTVDPVDDAPVANDQPVTTDEDIDKAITLTGFDVEGSGLSFTVVNQPDYGTLSGTPPNVTYSPDDNYYGQDIFTFKVNDGEQDSSEAAVWITVNPINDAPTANAQSVTTDEDVDKAITLTGSDVENSGLRFTVVEQPDHGALIGTAPNFTYSPADNYNGADSFTFKVNDGGKDSSQATVSITVNPIDDAPVANAQTITTDEDVARAIVLMGLDVEGSPLTYTVVDSPEHGTLSGTVPNLTYSPNDNYYGQDSFTFKVSSGGKDSSEATVSITVSPVNDAPTAVDDRYTTWTNQVLTIPVVNGVLANDNDMDGPALTAVMVDPPTAEQGTLVLNSNGSFTFTPAADFDGTVTFTYKAHDGGKDSPPAVVEILVNRYSIFLSMISRGN